MNNTERQQIINYLSGPRDYMEGVALYNRFGQNLRLKRTFSMGETGTTREILFEELRKLAGLSEAEYSRLPRRAASVRTALATNPSAPGKVSDPIDDRTQEIEELNDTIDDLNDQIEDLDRQIDELNEELDEARSKYQEAPEPVRKMISFRDRYPFLNSKDCPDELKILVADMISSYYRYKEAHARLQTLDDQDSEKAAIECEMIVKEYINNREIREELDYYKEHGKILGKMARLQTAEPAEDLSALSEIDLMKQLNSASANVSKHKKSVNAAQSAGESNEKAEAALQRWSARKTALQEEIGRRKKK